MFIIRHLRSIESCQDELKLWWTFEYAETSSKEDMAATLAALKSENSIQKDKALLQAVTSLTSWCKTLRKGATHDLEVAFHPCLEDLVNRLETSAETGITAAEGWQIGKTAVSVLTLSNLAADVGTLCTKLKDCASVESKKNKQKELDSAFSKMLEAASASEDGKALDVECFNNFSAVGRNCNGIFLSDLVLVKKPAGDGDEARPRCQCHVSRVSVFHGPWSWCQRLRDYGHSH